MSELLALARADLAPALEDPTSGPRIVVADDDATTRLILAGMLTAEGYQVAEASDGIEAQRRAQEGRPALVILDVDMPGQDGFEVCRALRAAVPTGGPPILILTGRNDEAAVTRAFEVGATDFAGKAISPALLLHRVRFLLRNAESVEAVRRSEAALESAQSIARLGSWEWHLPSGAFHYSRPALALLALQPEDALWSAQYFERVVPADRPGLRAAFAASREGGAPVDLRHRICLPDGSLRRVHTRAELVRDAAGSPEYLRGTVQDITEQVEADERIRYLTHFDQLTGLPNRSQFGEHLKVVLAHAQRVSGRAAVLLLDLTHFKRLNDQAGYEAGDAALAALSARLRAVLRQGDPVAREPGDAQNMVARLGGDEFMIALGQLERGENAAVVAQRVLEAVRAPFRFGADELALSGSIGISIYPDDGQGAEELIGHAESALEQAKLAGTGRFEFFDRRLSQAVAEQLKLEAAVLRAVDGEEFTLFYQPIVTSAGRIIGAEALFRWIQADGSIVPAAAVMPILEAKGLIPRVVEWTLRTGLRQLAAWDQLGLVLPRLAINLSPNQLATPGVVEHYDRIVREAGIQPSRITFEILEGALVSHPGAREILADFRRRGFKIAIDDFGTGYSALSYLPRFAVDILKIDRSFVGSLPGDPAHAAIVRAIISLATQLGIEPLAEGIEEPGQRDFLAGAGCRVMQGYLFGKAMSAEAFAVAAIASGDALPYVGEDGRTCGPHTSGILARAS